MLMPPFLGEAVASGDGGGDTRGEMYTAPPLSTTLLVDEREPVLATRGEEPVAMTPPGDEAVVGVDDPEWEMVLRRERGEEGRADRDGGMDDDTE